MAVREGEGGAADYHQEEMPKLNEDGIKLIEVSDAAQQQDSSQNDHPPVDNYSSEELLVPEEYKSRFAQNTVRQNDEQTPASSQDSRLDYARPAEFNQTIRGLVTERMNQTTVANVETGAKFGEDSNQGSPQGYEGIELSSRSIRVMKKEWDQESMKQSKMSNLFSNSRDKSKEHKKEFKK